MKRVLAILFVVSAPCALAETILVDPGATHMFVGDKFDARTAQEVLYEARPCKLPIVNAKDMRQYTTTTMAKPMEACWGRTLGGGVTQIFENGMSLQVTENAYVAASVDGSGFGVVTKSIYERRNYQPCTEADKNGRMCLKGQH
ncbi:hypothetical protein QN399_00875 [Pseudomonas sp. 10C3]|uniref:hypothetical protein n=1 Tax=Pseudomonas sp. 10C3 TaxID=3118753 RepID=UPI002E7FDA84|nr:hypothetical protein [Pseudomonas sp. 10C3]MEE3504828.1 hypothetical protein [Pseudomonas sp. 10C3]